MATATKSNIALRSLQGAIFAVERFLASMDWNGCGTFRRECVAHWTTLFATNEVVYYEPIIQNFLSFINHIVVQRRYIRFTRWLQWLCWPTYELGRNTEVGARSTVKKEVTRFIQITTMRGDFSVGYSKSPLITEMWSPKIKISNYLFFRPNKISYLYGQ